MVNKIKIEYKSGKIEETYLDENLEIIRIDIFTFIFDKEINSIIVYVGEEDLEYCAEIDSKEFSKKICLKYIKENIDIK